MGEARLTTTINEIRESYPDLTTADQIGATSHYLEVLPICTKSSLDPEQPDKANYGVAAALIGAAGHHRRADDVLHGYEAAQGIADIRYTGRPLYFLLMSNLGHVASQIIDTDLQRPSSPGEAVERIANVRWRTPNAAVEAATTLAGMLHEEQDVMPEGQAHSLEEVLLACNLFGTHSGYRTTDKRFKRLLTALPNSAEVEELVNTASTHYLTESGNLVMSQNAIADEMVFRYQEGDLSARRVTHAFMQVMGSGRSLDPDAMRRMKLLVLPSEIPDGTAVTRKERERYFMNGNAIVTAYVGLLLEGKVNCSLQELKFSTGLGETVATDKLWEDNDYDFSKVVWEALGHSSGTALQTHNKLKGYEYDAIKTKNNVLKNAIRRALIANYNDVDSNGSGGEAYPVRGVKLSDIMSHFGLGLYVARMDVRHGLKVPPTKAEVDSLGYTLDYPLERLCVPFPEDIQVASIGIPDVAVRRRGPKWEEALFRAMQLGKLAALPPCDNGAGLFNLPRLEAVS